MIPDRTTPATPFLRKNTGTETGHLVANVASWHREITEADGGGGGGGGGLGVFKPRVPTFSFFNSRRKIGIQKTYVGLQDDP